VKEIDLYLTPDSGDVAPIHRAAQHMPDGNIWAVDDLTIPAPGTWILQLDLLVDDFDRRRLDAVINIKP
jgi:hypothetical protein